MATFRATETRTGHIIGATLGFFSAVLYMFFQSSMSVLYITNGSFTTRCFQGLVGFRFILTVLCLCGLLFVKMCTRKAGYSPPPYGEGRDPPYQNATDYYMATGWRVGVGNSVFLFVLTFAYEFSHLRMSIKLSASKSNRIHYK